jgi:hypothetical protein
VCHATHMLGREKYLGNQTIKFSVLLSMGIGLASLIYRENTVIYLLCMGKSELMIFSLQHPFLPIEGGSGIKLNFFNPFRLSVNTIGYAFMVVVPVLYFKIFKFRMKQDTSVEGRFCNLLLCNSILLFVRYLFCLLGHSEVFLCLQ